MNKFLTEYINRIRKDFEEIPENIAHQITFAFLTFKMGLYEDTVRRCDRALPLVPSLKSSSVLRKALEIIRHRAQDLAESRVETTGLPEFNTDERVYLAVIPPADQIEDPVHLTITNSLVLLYAVGIVCSPEDVQALEEQERYVVQYLQTYRNFISL